MVWGQQAVPLSAFLKLNLSSHVAVSDLIIDGCWDFANAAGRKITASHYVPINNTS